jgi:cytochrome c553
MVRHRRKQAFATVVLATALAACNQAPTPGIARGEALFDTCVPCHGSDGSGNQELGAPAIAGLPQWYIQESLDKYQTSIRGAHPMDTVGIRMKSMSMALDLDGDSESVAEYVASMAATNPTPVLSGDASAGQALYPLCSACHGADGRGMEALHSPPLVGQHDWYLVAQLEKFKKGWRGADPADTWGGTMRPNAMTLDDAGMANVVAYILTLQ